MNCGCKNSPNRFCYICGHVALPLRRAEIMDFVKIGHSVELDESHQTMKYLLFALNYHKYKGSICAYLKVVGRTLSLQESYTKYPCFLCLWDSRADSQHYTLRKKVLSRTFKGSSAQRSAGTFKGSR